jgi:DNA-binding CsgD family transcriptional regulator
MKIFISWSGEESKQIALLLKPWLKKLLQATEPWMSDVDIEPGTRWSDKISAELKTSDFGIICVTPDNRSSEWIHFEAGALSIAMNDTERKVVPLLIGFEDRSGLQTGPLRLFNAVRFVKDDVWKLLLTLNADLQVPLDGNDLGELFEVFWPKLKADVDAIKVQKAVPAPLKKSPAELTEEVLEVVLDIRRRQESISSAGIKIPPLESFLPVPERSEDKMLTTREREIFKMAQAGMKNAEIAELLELSPRTVEGHLYQVFSKLGVTDRASLADIDPYQDVKNMRSVADAH